MFSEQGYKLELDIYLPSIYLAFEFQGRQHYTQFKYGKSQIPEKGIEHRISVDKTKEELSKVILTEILIFIFILFIFILFLFYLFQFFNFFSS